MAIINQIYAAVYGPWGRPDMAPSLLMPTLHALKEISIFNPQYQYKLVSENSFNGLLSSIKTPTLSEF